MREFPELTKLICRTFTTRPSLHRITREELFLGSAARAPRAMLAIVQELISGNLALPHDNGFAGMQNARVRSSRSFPPTFHGKPGT